MVNLLDFSLYLCFSVFKVLFSVFVSVESFFMVYSVGAQAGLTRMLFSLFISLRMRGSILLRMGSLFCIFYNVVCVRIGGCVVHNLCDGRVAIL